MSKPTTTIVKTPFKGYTQLFRGKDAKQKEARRLNTDMDTMSTGEVIGKLYDRHDTGFWMTIAVIGIASTIVVAIF